MRSLLFFPESSCIWDSVPSKSGIPTVKPHWPSKLESLEPPPPVARPPGWGALCGAQNTHSWGRTSGVYFPVCGSPPNSYGIWFHLDCAPLGCSTSFLVGSSMCFVVDGFPVSCDSGVSLRGELTPFYTAILSPPKGWYLQLRPCLTL